MCPVRESEEIESAFITEEREEEEAWSWSTSVVMILWSTHSFLVPTLGLITLAHVHPPREFITDGVALLTVSIIGAELVVYCVYDDQSHWPILRLSTHWGALTIPVPAFYSAFLLYESRYWHLGLSLTWTASAVFVHRRLGKYSYLPPGTMFEGSGPFFMNLFSLSACLCLGVKAGLLDTNQGWGFLFFLPAFLSTIIVGFFGVAEVVMGDLESRDRRRFNFSAWLNIYATLSHLYVVSTVVATFWPLPRPSYWSIVKGFVLKSIPFKCLFKTQ